MVLCQNQFESSVNSEGIETEMNEWFANKLFESSVNSEGIETWNPCAFSACSFESSVNSEGIETQCGIFAFQTCLRAV